MLNKKFMANVKKKLLSEKEDLLKKSTPRPEIDTDGDEADIIQGNILIDLHLQFVSLNNKKLFAIEEALRKIDDLTYGICIDCDEDIPEKRLLINPHFLICVDCSEDREIEEKQRKR